MARSKAELAADHTHYTRCVALARTAVSCNRFDLALDIAVESLACIPGMIQYEKREHDRETDAIELIDVIFRLAPALLRRDCLDAVGGLLKQSRRVDRDSSDDLAAGLERSRRRLIEVAGMWDSIIRANERPWQDVIGTERASAADSEDLAAVWVGFGCLKLDDRDGVRIADVPFRPTDLLLALCPECGAVARGAMTSFLSPDICPRCDKTVEFVLTDRKPRSV